MTPWRARSGEAGNVVVAAQLTESPVHGGPSRWLLPLPAIERAAAAVGHVNVQTEMEGVAREIEVQSADDSGNTIRAMAVEAVRVGDGTPEEGIPDPLTGRCWRARGPFRWIAPRRPVVIGTDAGALQRRMLRGGRMTIDFIGPAGSFAPDTYSLADVVAGQRAGVRRFQGKYVLIGATAAALGDHVASPFLHQTDARADQHGALMPGVEVLANEVNTILRARFVSETSDGAAFFWAALIALATLGLLEVAQGGREIVKQLAALGAAALLVILGSYLAFTRLLVFPPLVPAAGGVRLGRNPGPAVPFAGGQFPAGSEHRGTGGFRGLAGHSRRPLPELAGGDCTRLATPRPGMEGPHARGIERALAGSRQVRRPGSALGRRRADHRHARRDASPLPTAVPQPCWDPRQPP